MTKIAATIFHEGSSSPSKSAEELNPTMGMSKVKGATVVAGWRLSNQLHSAKPKSVTG